MKTKQLSTWAVILLLLTIGVTVQKLNKNGEVATEVYEPLKLDFDLDQIQKITLSRGSGQESVKLLYTQGEWEIASLWDAPAEKIRITKLLLSLRNAEGEQRSADAKLLPDFGIQDTEAFHIVLSGQGGKEIIRLLVGNKRSDTSSLFVRKANSNSVYFTRSPILRSLGIYGNRLEEAPKADYWSDLRLLKSDPDSLVSLETKMNGTTTSNAYLKDNKWQFERKDYPFEPDGEKIKLILESLRIWKGIKVVDPNVNYGFESPEWEMNVAFKDGREVQLLRMPSAGEANNFYLKDVSENRVLEILAPTSKKLDFDDAIFFKDNPLEIIPEKTDHLVIHTNQDELRLNPKESLTNELKVYLILLKTFRLDRLISDQAELKKVKKMGKFWIEVRQSGNENLVRVEFGTSLLDESKEYPVKIIGFEPIFTVSARTFQKIFEDLDDLKPEAEAV